MEKKRRRGGRVGGEKKIYRETGWSVHVCKSDLLHLMRTPRSGWCICLEAVTRAGPTLILVAFDAFRVPRPAVEIAREQKGCIFLPAIEDFNTFIGLP